MAILETIFELDRNSAKYLIVGKQINSNLFKRKLPNNYTITQMYLIYTYKEDLK